MTDDSEVARIAEGLNEYQVNGLKRAAPCKGGDFWTPYAIGDTSLSRCGVLTPLGLAVRDYLQSKGGDA